MNKSSTNNSLSSIKKLRHALLSLHKALLEYQKVDYEKKHGKIRNAQDLYTLAANDPSFTWLRSLSELIVSMDTLVETPKTATNRNIRALSLYIKSLISSGHRHARFEKEYYKALQKDPAVIIAHSKVIKLL